MNNFIKEYDDGHVLNRLYVYWDISTQCNFNCDYCYASAKYKPINEWGKIDSWTRQKLVLKALSFSKYPLFFGFHGGEPSLHPRLGELIHEALKILKDPLSQLYIVTNGYYLNPDIFGFPKDKVRILFSYHPYKKYSERFISNVKKVFDYGYKTKVNVLLVPEFADDLKKIFRECSFVKTHPHFIYDANGNHIEILRKYNNNFYKEFDFLKKSRCYYTFEDEQGNKTKISDLELFKNDLNHFKGWRCWNNNYEILWNGKCRKLCGNEQIDLTRNPFFFRNLAITPMICPFPNCLSDGVLKCLKEKI